jgi:hypothetical protein
MLLDRRDIVQPSSITRESTGFKLEISPCRHLYQVHDWSLKLNNSYAIVRHTCTYLVSLDRHHHTYAAILFQCSRAFTSPIEYIYAMGIISAYQVMIVPFLEKLHFRRSDIM